MKWLVGVDEAGRGPLAGPVAVGIAAVPANFDWNQISGVGDSKKLNPKAREAVFKAASALKNEGKLKLCVVQINAKVIDDKGIVFAITKALHDGLKKIGIEPSACRVLLDGGLKAPTTYEDQETIIKGDDKEKVIGLASIAAKVTRDHHMEKASRQPGLNVYGFDIHKGYGTKLHRELIKEHGLSHIHRATFCRGVRIK